MKGHDSGSEHWGVLYCQESIGIVTMSMWSRVVMIL